MEPVFMHKSLSLYTISHSLQVCRHSFEAMAKSTRLDLLHDEVIHYFSKISHGCFKK